MKRIRFYALIGITTISFLIGSIVGFGLCSSIQITNAKPIPDVMNIQNTQSNVNTQTIYVEGQKYIVFTSGSSSMAVIKR